MQRSAAGKQSIDAATALMIKQAGEHVTECKALIAARDEWNDDHLDETMAKLKNGYEKAGALMKAATPGLAKAESRHDPASVAKDEEERAERVERRRKLGAGVALADIADVGRMDLGREERQAPAGPGHRSGADVYKRDEQRADLVALRERGVDDARPAVLRFPSPAAAPPDGHRDASMSPVRGDPLMLKPVPTVREKGGFGRARGPKDPLAPAEEEEDGEEPRAEAPKAAAPSPAQALVDGAWELIKAGNPEGAEAQARKALLLDPNNVAALEVLALAQLKQGKFEEAIRTASGAIELDPRSASAWAFRAYAREALGDFAGGLADIERAASLEAGYGEKFRIAKAGGRMFEGFDPARARARHRVRWLIGAAACPLVGFLAWWLLLRLRREA